MTWSPDGRRIAYATAAKPARLAVIGADGTGAATLAQAPDNVSFGRGLAWSPDSTHVLANTGGGGQGGPPPPS
jgi:Tol biopolymer transport system component